MVKKIVSDSTIQRIINQIEGLDKEQAISDIVITENVKESSAKRYLCYARTYYIQIKVKTQEREFIEQPTWTIRGKPTERKKVKLRYPKRKKFKRLYYTHRFEFICVSISKMVELIHHFSYTDWNPFYSNEKAIKRHNAIYKKHQVIEVRYIDSLRPTFE